MCLVPWPRASFSCSIPMPLRIEAARTNPVFGSSRCVSGHACGSHLSFLSCTLNSSFPSSCLPYKLQALISEVKLTTLGRFLDELPQLQSNSCNKTPTLSGLLSLSLSEMYLSVALCIYLSYLPTICLSPRDSASLIES